MAHYTDSNQEPPFPTDVPQARFARISLSKIRCGDDVTSAVLFKACIDDGFFLMDLRDDSNGEELLRDAGKLFDLGRTLFDLPFNEKMRYVMGGARSVFGYKGVGLSKIDSEGTPDRCEFYGISKDDLMGVLPQLSAPTIIDENRELLGSFAAKNHELILLILSHLEKHLHLPPGTLASLHRLMKPSGDQIRILKYEPQPSNDRRTSLVPHTDFGSITTLFTVLGGLQVLPIGRENVEANWEYVKPQTGCAIINLGDSMFKWTNGLLKSAMHRVTYAPGKQADFTRWSLAYFAHPENVTLMKRINGSDVIPQLEEGVIEEDVTAVDWMAAGSTRYKQKELKSFEKLEEPEPMQADHELLPLG